MIPSSEKTEALSGLDEILNNLAGRRIGVLGLGTAGSAMARLLKKRGAVVIGADMRHELSDQSLY
ncbi:hypothetical protein KAI87_08590, partial [Myxococcota bacterium]|nr:hypothetical protein [Myxococcota bacterium]